MRSKMLSLCLLGTMLFTVGATAQTATTEKKFDPPTVEESQAVQKQGRYLATITLEGRKQIVLVLEGSMMPFTVANFKKLADSGFYNKDGNKQMSFHRVMDNAETKVRFAQAGDPKGDGTGGPGYFINLEVSPFLTHKKCAVAMAREADRPNTVGSQFFICTGDMPWLDGQYAVFGWVREGMETVNILREGQKIQSIVVEPFNGDDPCPVLAKPATRWLSAITAPTTGNN